MKFTEMITCVLSIESFDERTKQSVLAHIQAQNGLLESKEIDEEVLDQLTTSISVEGKTIEEIRGSIDEWIRENFNTDELVRLHGRDKSLAELIQAQDVRWENAWGYDSDFKHIINLAQEKLNDKADTTYIACPPKILTTSEDSLELNDKNLGNFIRENLSRLPGKFVLLIPLNDSQRHWLLGGIRIESGQLIRGTLWNSTSEIDEIVFNRFQTTLKAIDDRVEIKKINKKEQMDSFRCFDYVCREILNYVGTAEDQHIISSKTGNKLRDAIGEKIAKRLECQLPRPDSMTPLTERLSSLAINDPEVESAVKALKTALSKHNPKLVDEFDRTGVLIVNTRQEKLMFSCSTDESKSERPEELKPDLTGPKNLDAQLAQAVNEKENDQPEFTEEKIRRLEESFRVNYDDSSDSEDEQDDRVTGIDLNKYKFNVTRGRVAYNQWPHIRISFYLHVLGLMLLKSNNINKHYKDKKKQHLAIDEDKLRAIKSKLLKLFKDDGIQGAIEDKSFEDRVWILFLSHFRAFAKKHNATSEILFHTAKEILKDLQNRKKAGSDIKITAESLAKKILPLLPLRQTPSVFRMSMEKQHNADHEILSIIRFLYRLFQRKIKDPQLTEHTITITVKSHSVDILDKVEVKTNRIRVEKIDGLGKYTSILGPLGNGHSSIAKHTTAITHKQFITDMYNASHGTLSKKDEPSYSKFLEKFYYLLQRAETSRNPASSVINPMLFQLICFYNFQWGEILPKNDVQRDMFATNHHPILVHPMTFENAPKAAAVLIGYFNYVLEPPLKYYVYQETSGYKQNHADIIAGKQYSIASQWFFCSRGKPIENANDDEILESLWSLANDHYFPR